MDDVTPPTPETPQDPVVPEYVAELKSLNEAALAKIEELNQQLEALKPTPQEPAYDPAADPDLVPPADWKVAREEIETRAEKKALEVVKRIEEERERIRAEEAKKAEELNARWDAQLLEAEKSELIAPIADPKNPDDAGIRDRQELFGLAAKLGTDNLPEVARQLKTMHDTGVRYDFQKDEFVRTESHNRAIPTMPVATNSRPVVPQGPATPDLKYLRSRSLDRIVADFERLNR